MKNAIWAGRVVVVVSRVGVPSLPIKRNIQPGSGYKVSEPPKEYLPFSSAPSGIDGKGIILKTESLGERLSLLGMADMQAIGEATHSFLAVDVVTR
jgi:hypothetical protein